MQKTLSIIKPDAVKAFYTGKIIDFIENKGLQIVAQKRILLTRKHAESFYQVHKEKPFFSELVDFMVSGPIVVQVLTGENTIEYYRSIMGSTDPNMAAEDSIRKLYGKNIQCNAVHGSDSLENAEIEISFFFSKLELIN